MEMRSAAEAGKGSCSWRNEHWGMRVRVHGQDVPVMLVLVEEDELEAEIGGSFSSGMVGG